LIINNYNLVHARTQVSGVYRFDKIFICFDFSVLMDSENLIPHAQTSHDIISVTTERWVYVNIFIRVTSYCIAVAIPIYFVNKTKETDQHKTYDNHNSGKRP
jgi:hypothetical protein